MKKWKNTGIWRKLSWSLRLPGGSVVKNPPAKVGNARDTDLIPELGRSPGVGHGNLLQYSCLENPKDRGVWQASVHGTAVESKENWGNPAHTHACRPAPWYPYRMKVKVKVAQCLTLCNPMGYTRVWNSPGQNTGVGSPSLLQGIFPTQKWNWGLLHCKADCLPTELLGKPL